MMSDQLVEISTERQQVTRRLRVTPGREQLLAIDDLGESVMHSSDGERCKPTWVTISPDDHRLYVPCTGHAEIIEIDAISFEVRRRFPTGKAPYNADVTPDGRSLVVTLKGAQAVALFDLTTGTETRVPTTQPITHGIAITPDSRYAFISNEAIGATRGTVDLIDLREKERIASVAVQHQPGGIAFWKMEPGKAPGASR